MNNGDPATTGGNPKTTEVGSVFVSNYPPYSAWDQTGAAQARRVLEVIRGLTVELHQRDIERIEEVERLDGDRRRPAERDLKLVESERFLDLRDDQLVGEVP